MITGLEKPGRATRPAIRIWLVAALALVAGMAIMPPAVVNAEGRTPLLMEGKQTLYQRVLTRPGGELRAEPGENNPVVVPLAPFEPFFVFARKTIGDRDWIEIGRNRSDADGWLVADRAIPWAQTIVAAFSNPAGRKRTLVFRSRDEMDSVFNSENVSALMNQLRTNAEAGLASQNGPVVSIEPENFVDIDSNFYILPILNYERARIQGRQRAKYLKIASLPLKEAKDGIAADQADLLAGYKVGIVFVLDTTMSMQPYIEQTRDAIDEIRRKISGSPEGERVRFGLVGFRDSIKLAPALKYVTKTFLKLDSESSARDFVRAIDGMEAARVSSVGFDEDSIAGVMSAVSDMDWEQFGGRYIVLVTDAAPRQPGEDAQNGNLDVPELNRLAREKGIALVTLHLKTEQGAFEHEEAEASYRAMSATDQGGTLYFSIDTGDPHNFRRTVGDLATALTDQITQTIQGRLSEPQPGTDTPIANETQLVGRAMQLAYLGRVAGTATPDILVGWISDRDPLNTRARPVDIRVLMSKNELSTLRDVVRETIDIGNSVSQQGDSREFFRRLQEAMAHMARDPEHIVNTGFTTLGDALGEYLADLPYESEITGLTAEDWEQLSPSRERLLVDSLESKIVALDRIHNDSDRWVAPYTEAPDGEYVTTVPLSVLP